ncbi:MAG: hypothetical protein LBS82_01330 [Spirochaetaceae bacterium]|jgi:hypothetical protein|nr:hypothetical protein [Spirochaetaceae bacterium]
MKYILILIASVVCAACDQAPLFYTISKEVAPKTALIPGALTKIARQGDELFVGNGNLWRFSGGSWGQMSKPPGTVRDVAAAEDGSLYALTMDNKTGDTAVWGKLPDDEWTELVSAPNLGYQALFCANNVLFISRWNGTSASDMTKSFTLLIWDGPEAFQGDNTALVNGVVYAGGKYYLATAGEGVYMWDGVSTGLTRPFSTLSHVLGIINLDDTHIAAVSRTGGFYQIDASTDTLTSNVARAVIHTGALAVWTSPPPSDGSGPQKVLLIGINRNDNANYGYNEVAIKADGTLEAVPAFNEPGKGAPSSVNDYDRYLATLEKHPVHSLMQAPGVYNKTGAGLPVVFAATQKDGLWTYRDDASVNQPVWNAQD